MLKKILALIMCVVLMCSMGLSANAQSSISLEDYIIEDPSNNSEIQPYYNYTYKVSASLGNSSGKALCGANVIGYNGTTTKIKITMTLQRKVLLLWSDVEEWTTTVSSYQATLSKTATVNSGKTYRVKVEAVVYCGSNSETVSCTSGTKEF